MGRTPRPLLCAPESLQILIRGKNIQVTTALRAYIERRIAFTMSRFGGKIGRVSVDCSEADDALGGNGKRCQIGIELPRAVRVQDTDPDLMVAIKRAADRAARSVALALARDSGM